MAYKFRKGTKLVTIGNVGAPPSSASWLEFPDGKPAIEVISDPGMPKDKILMYGTPHHQPDDLAIHHQHLALQVQYKNMQLRANELARQRAFAQQAQAIRSNGIGGAAAAAADLGLAQYIMQTHGQLYGNFRVSPRTYERLEQTFTEKEGGVHIISEDYARDDLLGQSFLGQSFLGQVRMGGKS